MNETEKEFKLIICESSTGIVLDENLDYYNTNDPTSMGHFYFDDLNAAKAFIQAIKGDNVEFEVRNRQNELVYKDYRPPMNKPIVVNRRPDLFSRKNLLISLFVIVFICTGLFLQKRNHKNNYYDFVSIGCKGKIESIGASSVGTKIVLQSGEHFIFHPEKVPNCGFFNRCFSKGDSIVKLKGEDFVDMIKQGQNERIIIRSKVKYKR